MQGGPSVEDYLKARDAIEPERRVIVVVGITGAGMDRRQTRRGSRAKELRGRGLAASVRTAADPVVGVENRLEPHRTQSTPPPPGRPRMRSRPTTLRTVQRPRWPSSATGLNELDVQDDDVAIADDTEQGTRQGRPRGERRAVAVN